MEKSKINNLLRVFAKEKLTPLSSERNLISKIYSSIQEVLGAKNTIQVGSYPRLTSITPIHDLDIFYIAGNWQNKIPDPKGALSELKDKIISKLVLPAGLTKTISIQTHSVTILITEGKKEILSIDIVPAYISGKLNEFNQDIYFVPEIILHRQSQRSILYEERIMTQKPIGWIQSDPRGYIEISRLIDNNNKDFKRTVKLVKAWKANCVKSNEKFKLKSFHIEQVLSKYFRNKSDIDIYDSMYQFFCDIPEIIGKAQIPDRADSQRKIDDYLDKLTSYERDLILQARDGFLIKLENFSNGTSIEELLEANFHTRKSGKEKYLFDDRIPVLTEDTYALDIIAKVLERQGGFRSYILDKLGIIAVDRKIQFRAKYNNFVPDVLKWKVKNDDKCVQPRGEISNYTTLNDPESTKYKGEHYVECYAIKDGICIARAKQNVVLKHFYSS